MSEEFTDLAHKADEDIGEKLEDAELKKGRAGNQRQKGLMLAAIVALICINTITLVWRQSTADQAQLASAVELFVIVDELVRAQYLASEELPESLDSLALEDLVHYRKLDATTYELTPLVVPPPYNVSATMSLTEVFDPSQLPSQFSTTN
ncbi:MAG: hypothetical protein HOL48_02630 [Porticoccaceae bacterium]|jgi:hypothetical protein|nr:hypothetical protein [Porticoccaceae bacterium]